MFRFDYVTSNVYKQLGFADAEEIPRKAGIVRDIAERMTIAGITLSDAATMVGAHQSDLALVLCGKFQNIGAEELRGWLTRLGFPLQ